MAKAELQVAVGIEAEAANARAEVRPTPTLVPKGPIVSDTEYIDPDLEADHFITVDGVQYAGHHLIIDLWQSSRLDDLDHVEAALIEAVEEAGATLLHIHLHHFTPNGGISGVAVLAESHISIHTWPEKGYAALDVFMCGDAKPMKTLPVLKRAFTPGSVQVSEMKRGMVG
ncbi:MAG: adenosylmethionine decarboxylase [Alphaproteobacteria bacterium]